MNGLELNFETASDLVIHIDKVSSDYVDRPIGAFLTKESGETLMTTLGLEKSVLAYFPADYAETGLNSFHSISHSERFSHHVVYFVDSEYTEAKNNWTVNKSQAQAAIRDFLIEEGLPGSIDWEKD